LIPAAVGYVVAMMPGPIGDLALLSDCQTAALVTRDGSVDWWPGPRFDGPSVFARLLDPDAGHLSVRPATPSTTSTRAYLDGTLVLRTEHRAGDATLVVTDALALDPAAEGHEIGLDVPHALVRVLEAVGGDVDVEVEYVPRTEYGLVVPRLTRERGAIVTIGGPEQVTLTGADELELDDSSAHGVLTLRAGERRGIVVRRGAAATLALDGPSMLEGTIGAWRSWSALHGGHGGPYAGAVELGARVLQGLTYQPSGAIVAAPSTSLPETLGASANWDYRYAWLRDASLVARALLGATCSEEARRYFEWMTGAAVSCRASSHVQIVFGVRGERNLEERALDHLRGFADSRPVRIGNAAWRQKQLDVMGEILDVAWSLGDELELDEFSAAFLCQLADRAARQWQEPDTGMWESRGPARHHTMSKVMCWVALDRAARLGARLGEHATPRDWRRAADRVRATVLHEAWSERRGAFAGVCGSDALDSALLLMPAFGFVAANDDRMASTAAAIESALGDGGLLRRHEELDEQGAFLPSTFWLAAWRAQAGDADAARAAFERAAGCANDVGLLAEMVDPATGAALGNMPQALSHVGLVDAAARIADAERAPAGGGVR
jgi:GH15 family glucan-1,4-alpha-glucosidase